VLANYFELEDTAKIAKPTFIAPADLADNAKYGTPARGGEFDLVIFDRCAPPDEKSLPLANAFFIDDLPPPWDRSKQKPLKKNAFIRNTSSSHSLMRHLTGLDEIAFVGGFEFDLRAEGVPLRVPKLLESSGETALMFVLPRRAYRDLVLAFPLV